MGDRCWAGVRCRAEHVEAFRDMGLDEEVYEDELHKGTWHCQGEVNYGGVTDLEAIAARGIPFVGRHDHGDEYGGCVFASADGNYAECETYAESYAPWVPAVMENGAAVADPEALGRATRYYEIEALAEAQIGGAREG